MAQGIDGKLWVAADSVSISYQVYPGCKTDYFYSVIHGFAEHSGRYTKLIESLQATGRAVLTYDLRGHGRSGGERGAIASWPRFWEDYCGLSAYLKRSLELPACRTIVVGHSLGGLIALDGALRDGKDIGGLILSSPCLGLSLAPGLRLLNFVIARLCPSFSYSRPVKPEDLSRDVSVCQAYGHDPLVLKRIRAQTLQAVINAGDSLQKATLKLGVPVWFLAAGNDRVVDLKQTLRVYAQLDAPFKKLKIFEAFRHEIFNEVHSEIAYDTALQAIEQIVEFNAKYGQGFV